MLTPTEQERRLADIQDVKIRASKISNLPASRTTYKNTRTDPITKLTTETALGPDGILSITVTNEHHQVVEEVIVERPIPNAPAPAQSSASTPEHTPTPPPSSPAPPVESAPAPVPVPPVKSAPVPISPTMAMPTPPSHTRSGTAADAQSTPTPTRGQYMNWSLDAPAIIDAFHQMNANCSRKRPKANIGIGNHLKINPAITTMTKLIDNSTDIAEWDEPKEANLDDTALFALKKLQNRASCGRVFPRALDSSGYVRLTRKPEGKPPVALAFGVKWLYLVDGRYILTGKQLAQTFPWVTSNARPLAQGGKSPFAVGYVTIPEDWTEEDYQLLEDLDNPSEEGTHTPEDDTDDDQHTWHNLVKKLNTQTQIRTDFDQYAIVPPSKGGQLKAVRMSDLPGFRLPLHDTAHTEDSTQSEKEPRAPTRKQKPKTTATNLNDQNDLSTADERNASLRELIRSCAHSENNDMMKALGRFVVARNALVRCISDNLNSTEVPRLIQDFKASSAAAEAEIDKRVRKNRRGAAFCKEFLYTQQIDGVDTGIRQDGPIKDRASFLCEDTANCPSARLTTRIKNRSIVERKRARSPSTSQEE